MEHKNILLITTDQQKADAKGDGDNFFTPNLDRLQQMGVNFSNHICSSAQCTPSRATWMTGKYPHEVGVNQIGHMLDPEEDNIAKLFNEQNYETAYFGKWHLGGKPENYGFTTTDYRTDGADFWGTNEHRDFYSYKDAIATAQTLNFLDDYSPDRDPFFMHVSWYMPHPNNPNMLEQGPFEEIDAYNDKFKENEMAVPESYYSDDLSSKPAHQKARAFMKESQIDEQLIKKDAVKYRKLVSLIDRNLGKILGKLEEKNMLEDTIIAFTSDHGDMQGAHKLRLKGVIPYKELYHVPFIVYVPGMPSKRDNIDDITCNVSLANTLLDAAGIGQQPSFYPSLLPLLNEEKKDDKAHVFFEHYRAYWGFHPFRGIQTQNLKYVYYYEDQVEEMYDLKNDPDEINNICEDPTFESAKKKLKDMVDDWWENTGGLSKEPMLDTDSEWMKIIQNEK